MTRHHENAWLDIMKRYQGAVFLFQMRSTVWVPMWEIFISSAGISIPSWVLSKWILNKLLRLSRSRWTHSLTHSLTFMHSLHSHTHLILAIFPLPFHSSSHDFVTLFLSFHSALWCVIPSFLTLCLFCSLIFSILIHCLFCLSILIHCLFCSLMFTHCLFCPLIFTHCLFCFPNSHPLSILFSQFSFTVFFVHSCSLTVYLNIQCDVRLLGIDWNNEAVAISSILLYQSLSITRDCPRFVERKLNRYHKTVISYQRLQ